MTGRRGARPPAFIEESLNQKDRPYQKPEVQAKPKATKKTKVEEGLKEIDPHLIVPWAFANRPDSEFGDMEGLVDSIAHSGQHVPGLVRPIAGGRFELIYGRRRWRAVKALGMKMLCQVRALKDEEAFLAQAVENEQRKDLSAWARAEDYQRALKQGLFPSQAALARSLNLSRGLVNSILRLHQIPRALVEEIGDMSKISINTGNAIVQLTEEGYEEKLLTFAKPLREGRLGEAQLTRSVKEAGKKRTTSRVVRDEHGRELFSVTTTARGANQITILKAGKEILPMEEIERRLLEMFKP